MNPYFYSSESPSGLPKVFTRYGSGGRTLNSAFTISTTRDAFVSYSLDFTATLTLIGGTSSIAFLEFSDNGGATWQDISKAGVGLTGGVVVGVSITNAQSGPICGMIKAGWQVRIRTTGTTPVFADGQEVLL